MMIEVPTVSLGRYEESNTVEKFMTSPKDLYHRQALESTIACVKESSCVPFI